MLCWYCDKLSSKRHYSLSAKCRCALYLQKSEWEHDTDPSCFYLQILTSFHSIEKIGLVSPLFSILLHSGLNLAWHSWLSTRFSCCLKMKSIWEHRENIWNCSRKYPKMFKTDSFLGNKKLSFNQNVWHDHAIMQQDVLLHFWVIFLYWNQTEIWKKYSVVQL